MKLLALIVAVWGVALYMLPQVVTTLTLMAWLLCLCMARKPPGGWEDEREEP